MPTGYTYGIEKENIDFRTYAIRCAHAFGALIHRKDSGAQDTLPDEIPIPDYHLKEIEKAKKLKKKLFLMKDREQEKYNKKRQKEEQIHFQEAIKEVENSRKKYETMLKKVKKWKPPSSDHKNMKAFMIEQIEMSIDNDCDVTYYETKIADLRETNYQQKELEEAIRDIQYHEDEYKKEVKRTKDRNKWIKLLKNSL